MCTEYTILVLSSYTISDELSHQKCFITFIICLWIPWYPHGLFQCHEIQGVCFSENSRNLPPKIKFWWNWGKTRNLSKQVSFAFWVCLERVTLLLKWMNPLISLDEDLTIFRMSQMSSHGTEKRVRRNYFKISP